MSEIHIINNRKFLIVYHSNKNIFIFLIISFILWFSN